MLLPVLRHFIADIPAIGNAWAAAGMLRVLMTMNRTTQAERFEEQSANLALWINEITESAWRYQVCLVEPCFMDIY